MVPNGRPIAERVTTRGSNRSATQSIRWRFVLMGLVCVLPLVVFSILLVVREYHEGRQIAVGYILETVQATLSAVDAEFETALGTAQALATSPAAIVGDIRGLRAHVDGLLPTLPVGYGVLLYDETGQQFLNSHRAPSEALPRRRNMAAVRLVFESGKPAYSEVFVGSAIADPVASVDVPVMRDDGTVKYGLAVNIPISAFSKILEGQRFAEERIAAIADQTGTIAARTWEQETFVGKTLGAPLRQAMTEAREGVIETSTLEGSSVISVFRRSYKTGWAVVIGLPVAALELDLRRSIAVTTAMGITVLVVALLLAFLVARRIIVTIYRIRDSALLLAQKDMPDLPDTNIVELRDLSDAMQDASERIGLLVNELNHRVKNTLASVHSIAIQTGRNAGSVDDFVTAFESRLLALSRTHDLLTANAWRGAALGRVVRETLSPFTTTEVPRIRLSGEGDVELPMPIASALAMSLNELATNASKYGSLSNRAGEVRVSWRVDEMPGGHKLHLRWQEIGGPPVLPPARRGFGSRMIERGLPLGDGAKVDLQFDPAGVHCEIELFLTKADHG